MGFLYFIVFFFHINNFQKNKKIFKKTTKMYNFRRFAAVPTTSSKLLASSSSSSVAVLFNSMNFATTTSSGNNNRGGNNNNYRNNNNNNNRNYKDEQIIQATPARLSSFNRNGEPFCEISNAADNSSEGYRLIVSFPTINCNYMDIQYAPQIRDKTPISELTSTNSAEGKSDEKKSGGGPRRQKIFGMPVLPLTIRLYPMQMAKVVSLLEGRSSEAVIASRLGTGTFKRNSAANDGSIIYSVQTRTPEKIADGQATSMEVTIDPINCFMLEKFLNKMLVMGFDPSRDEMPNKNRL